MKTILKTVTNYALIGAGFSLVTYGVTAIVKKNQ